MRKPFVCGNFKMFKTVRETVDYVDIFAPIVQSVTGVDVAIAPPFVAVHAAAQAASGTRVGIGAQTLHWEREGAFTGEVSAHMLREAGARYVIIGHSERRTLFGETNTGVNKKLGAALGAGLVPIVCVGETLDQRERGETFAVLDRQLKEGLDGVTGERLTGIVVAYEPVWAIGTGKTATPREAQDAHAHIRGRLKSWFGVEAADRCRMVYGGSVKLDNIGKLMAEPDIDGALVGGACLDPKVFGEMVAKAAG
jgi:triosephosphate isomerase